MEAIQKYEGWKRTLLKALNNDKSVKLIFQYPSTNRATVKSGRVIAVDDNSFTVSEIKDGESTFAYTFLIELYILGGGE